MANLLTTAAQVARRALTEAWQALQDPSQAVLSDRERLKHAEETIETVRGEWRSYKLEVNADLEALSDLAGTIEIKRKRLAARESAAARKGNGPDGAAADPKDPDNLMADAVKAGVVGRPD